MRFRSFWCQLFENQLFFFNCVSLIGSHVWCCDAIASLDVSAGIHPFDELRLGCVTGSWSREKGGAFADFVVWNWLNTARWLLLNLLLRLLLLSVAAA